MCNMCNIVPCMCMYVAQLNNSYDQKRTIFAHWVHSLVCSVKPIHTHTKCKGKTNRCTSQTQILRSVDVHVCVCPMGEVREQERRILSSNCDNNPVRHSELVLLTSIKTKMHRCIHSIQSNPILAISLCFLFEVLGPHSEQEKGVEELSPKDKK